MAGVRSEPACVIYSTDWQVERTLRNGKADRRIVRRCPQPSAIGRGDRELQFVAFGEAISAIVELDRDVVKFAGFQGFRFLVAVTVGEVENLVADECDATIGKHIVEAQRYLGHGAISGNAQTRNRCTEDIEIVFQQGGFENQRATIVEPLIGRMFARAPGRHPFAARFAMALGRTDSNDRGITHRVAQVPSPAEIE